MPDLSWSLASDRAGELEIEIDPELTELWFRYSIDHAAVMHVVAEATETSPDPMSMVELERLILRLLSGFAVELPDEDRAAREAAAVLARIVLERFGRELHKVMIRSITAEQSEHFG